MNRCPDVLYPSIARLGSDLGKLKINVGCGQMKEFAVSAVYATRVVLEIPNHQGGHRYLAVSYEDIEYPMYSIACRAIISNDALRLHPDDPRGRRDRQAKIEEQRRRYIEDHWRDIYSFVVNAAIDPKLTHG